MSRAKEVSPMVSVRRKTGLAIGWRVDSHALVEMGNIRGDMNVA
jgi:hypothetical protein